MIHDDNQYAALLSDLLEKLTAIEHQILSRIAKSEGAHRSTVDAKKKERDRCHIAHYHHEQRFTTLRKEVHRLLTGIFEKTSTTHTRLIEGHRNNRNKRRELMHMRSTNYPKL